MLRSRRIIVVLAAALAAPAIARAQDTGRGFLFGTPMGSVTIRGGWALARAKSDLFSFTTDQLTLSRGDFSSPEVGVDLAARLASRTDLVFSSGISGMSRQSEFRHFIDNDNQPIQQTTTFLRVPVTIGIKQYLTSPGRSIGRFAWIPSRVAAYVGAGGGLMYYKFRQAGDFIDFQTTDVFSSLYASDGWTGTTYAAAGLEYSLGPRFALTTEARYLWSNARLSNDFSGFDHLDLSGASTTIGLSVRF
jgi:hypothetical protein